MHPQQSVYIVCRVRCGFREVTDVCAVFSPFEMCIRDRTNNGGGVIVNPGQWLLNAIGSLTQPLFNRGTNIANLKIAKTRQEEAKLLFQQSLLNAGKEVNDALTAWQTAKSQIEINARQVETLCDAVRLSLIHIYCNRFVAFDWYVLQIIPQDMEQKEIYIETVSGVVDPVTGTVQIKALFPNPDRELLSGRCV